MTQQQPTEGAPLTTQQLNEIRAVAQRAEARPFLLSDCEGELKVWAESALKYVRRDESGEITGWSEPGAYRSADLVAEVELDMGTWDPGEDEDDDQRRHDIGDLVRARAALPALLAEVTLLQEHFDKAIAGFNAQSLRVTELEAEVERQAREIERLTAVEANARKLVSEWLSTAAEHISVSHLDAVRDEPLFAGMQEGRANQYSDCANELRDVLDGEDPDGWTFRVAIEVASAGAGEPAPPCDCGQPIPAGRVAFCPDRCRNEDRAERDTTGGES